MVDRECHTESCSLTEGRQTSGWVWLLTPRRGVGDTTLSCSIHPHREDGRTIKGHCVAALGITPH